MQVSFDFLEKITNISLRKYQVYNNWIDLKTDSLYYFHLIRKYKHTHTGFFINDFLTFISKLKMDVNC